MKRLGHNPMLDGLRGVAILLVLVHHVHGPLAAGGDTGVDLFFILSGFLITKLMIEERDATQRLDMPAFYARRFFRIVPALVLACIGAVVVANVWRKDLSANVGKEVAFSLLFSGNFREIFFPIVPAARNLLGVTWSLGLEEQFYWLWPLALVLVPSLFNRPMRTVKIILAVGWIGALIGRVGVGMIGGYEHYSLIPFFNFDGMLLGAAMAFIYHHRAEGSGRFRIPGWAVVVSVAFVTFDVFFSSPYHDDVYGFRNVVARLAYGATMWWLLTDGAKSIWSTLLGHPILRFFGRISYSLYLWHTIVFMAFKLDDPPEGEAIWRKAAGLAVAIGLSLASFYLVERPATRYRHRMLARRAERATAADKPLSPV